MLQEELLPAKLRHAGHHNIWGTACGKKKSNKKELAAATD
jgi:hypothetical protein